MGTVTQKHKNRSRSSRKSKPKALCQCPNNATNTKDYPCKNLATNGTLFCDNHQNCKPAPINGYEPKYIPNILNKSFAYLETNNCLSYALRGNNINKELVSQCKSKNDCDVNFEQPGAASGIRGAMKKENLRTCPVVKKLVTTDLGDDFIPSTFYSKCPKGYSKVALVVDNGTDYHWYRQNKDGTWSHKDGSNPVKNFDALKKRIFNPKQISRDYGEELNYEDFCGFFCVNRQKRVRLKQGGKRKQSGSGIKTRKNRHFSDAGAKVRSSRRQSRQSRQSRQ